MAIFVAAAFFELAGAYAVWRWRRLDGAIWLVPAGAAALVFYALVQTWQPEASFGRLYAAYAGVFLVGAMSWGRIVDGAVPDRADLVGAAVILAGIGIVLWGRHLGA